MNDSNIINNLENLKKIRTSRNITQVKLSTDLEVSQEVISRYEVGTSFPQPNMLIKLARYFNCSTDYLLGLTDVTTPIQTLASNQEQLKASELYNKYISLSKDDQKYFDRFLAFLLNDNKHFKK